MAKPIAKTPVLRGKDAKAFLDNLLLLATQKQTASSKRKEEEEIRKMKQSYDTFLAISEVGVL